MEVDLRLNKAQNSRYKYVKLHFHVLLLCYQKVLISTDKSLFEKLFNLKSFFLRTKSRVKWTGSCFVVLDKRIPNFSYEFRHQRQGNMAYEKGIIERAEILSKSYFLDLIDFKKGDVFFDCGANVGDIHIWFELNNTPSGTTIQHLPLSLSLAIHNCRNKISPFVPFTPRFLIF